VSDTFENSDVSTAPFSNQTADDLGFMDNFSATVDSKNRLMVPIEFRRLLQRKSHECAPSVHDGSPGVAKSRTAKPIEVVVTVLADRYSRAAVFPLPEWKRIRAEMKKVHTLNLDAQHLYEFMASLATRCQLDSIGRIRFSKIIAEEARLRPQKSVIVAGAGSYFSVWSEGEFARFVADVKQDSKEKAERAQKNIPGMASAAIAVLSKEQSQSSSNHWAEGTMKQE